MAKHSAVSSRSYCVKAQIHYFYYAFRVAIISVWIGARHKPRMSSFFPMNSDRDMRCREHLAERRGVFVASQIVALLFPARTSVLLIVALPRRLKRESPAR